MAAQQYDLNWLPSMNLRGQSMRSSSMASFHRTASCFACMHDREMKRRISLPFVSPFSGPLWRAQYCCTSSSAVTERFLLYRTRTLLFSNRLASRYFPSSAIESCQPRDGFNKKGKGVLIGIMTRPQRPDFGHAPHQSMFLRRFSFYFQGPSIL
jgi:hypothetical protein